jgi:hypothetical protein
MLTLSTDEGKYEVASNHAIKLDASNCNGYYNRGVQELVINIFVSYDAGLGKRD